MEVGVFKSGEGEVEVAAARLAADMLATPMLSDATPLSLSAALMVDLASTPIGMVNLDEAYHSANLSAGNPQEQG